MPLSFKKSAEIKIQGCVLGWQIGVFFNLKISHLLKRIWGV